MDFNDTPEEATFRTEAQQWLAANAPRFEGGYETWQQGLARARDWQAAKFDAGWACIRWPEQYGGRGGTTVEDIIFAEEEARFDLPRGFLIVGPHTCAGALLACANEEQKRNHLPKIARADEVWCQLFSEPEAGSDLAGLRTRAERDGDEWVINGQKVWNSEAHYADHAILVTRSHPELPKHKGLTFFIVDMKSPGIEVRPIKQIPGTAEFNEVYLQNVRIPDSNRIGEVGAGWQVAISTLMNERFGTSSGRPSFADILGLVRRSELPNGPAIADAGIRSRLADWYVAEEGVRLTFARSVSALSKGQEPGPEASISKLVMAPQRQELCSFGADLQEMAGVLAPEAVGEQSSFQAGFLAAPGSRIAAGTDEILRNIIAERVLGLPGDIRVDRDVPFSDIPARD
jgi:alkylation response protein AidB-like acyl-CoA dehydrogenase